MKVRSFDEYPFPQAPTPFDIPATSDVHFNDGYFCAAFARDFEGRLDFVDGISVALRGLRHALRYAPDGLA